VSVLSYNIFYFTYLLLFLYLLLTLRGWFTYCCTYKFLLLFVSGGLVVCVLDQALWERFQNEKSQTEQYSGASVYDSSSIAVLDIFNMFSIKLQVVFSSFVTIVK